VAKAHDGNFVGVNVAFRKRRVRRVADSSLLGLILIVIPGFGDKSARSKINPGEDPPAAENPGSGTTCWTPGNMSKAKPATPGVTGTGGQGQSKSSTTGGQSAGGASTTP